jgi:hypothetical protein
MPSPGGHLCVFCTVPRERMVDENVTAIAIRDGYPVSPGHDLVTNYCAGQADWVLSRLEISTQTNSPTLLE